MTPHIVVISPPFFSHFNPMLVLAKSFARQGAKVTVASSLDFRDKVLEADLAFYSMDISNNRNTGDAESTNQGDAEKERLEQFFEATRKGAVQTLMLQTAHRKEDMLFDPLRLMESIKTMSAVHHVDLYVVDLLSYGVTMALTALHKPFITFCPPHPYTIPDSQHPYGIPRHWPNGIHVQQQDLSRLHQMALDTERDFTRLFNQLLQRHRGHHKPIGNAFSFVSDTAVIYNYLPFDEEQAYSKKSYCIGHCFEPRRLPPEWLERVDNGDPKVLISLGTFLSNRADVIRRLMSGVKAYDPNIRLYVAAGTKVSELKAYADDRDIVEGFIPQEALVPYMDLVIHHGGNNTFTETLYHGKPMIILPFSSDQFNVAYDAQRLGLASILDPNAFNEEQMSEALESMLRETTASMETWSEWSRKAGPDLATKAILEELHTVRQNLP